MTEGDADSYKFIGRVSVVPMHASESGHVVLDDTLFVKSPMNETKGLVQGQLCLIEVYKGL
jgi:hypothetical protein